MVSIFQFKYGAMENWGLITSKEKYLIFDPSTDTTLDKFRIAQVVAHEIAHQFFGINFFLFSLKKKKQKKKKKKLNKKRKKKKKGNL